MPGMTARKFTSREPVAVGALAQMVVTATLAVLAAFGVWSPTEEQTAAIFGALTALLAVVAAAVRAQVSPIDWD